MAAPEPIFLDQWRMPEDEKDPMGVLRQHLEVAREKGVTWVRVSYHPDDLLLFLIEGWAGHPIDPDTNTIEQGPQRWKDESNG